MTTSLEVRYQSTDTNGVKTFQSISPVDGGLPQTLRVLQPTQPAAGVTHNFLFVLPVQPGVGTTYGDGVETMKAVDAANQYNLTIVQPSFPIDPWYANTPDDPGQQHETFMADLLAPWAESDLAITGQEQKWLMGFSKSGIGAQSLLLKYPDVFSLAASWDFPANTTTYDRYGSSSADSYGTQANFAANYELTGQFLSSRDQSFHANSRIWIGGYKVFRKEVKDYGALLGSAGILHTMGAMKRKAHRWDSGWVPGALAGLCRDSVNLRTGG